MIMIKIIISDLVVQTDLIFLTDNSIDIYIYIYIYIYKLVKLATFVEGDPKASFSIATTTRCRGGRYSILYIL